MAARPVLTTAAAGGSGPAGPAASGKPWTVYVLRCAGGTLYTGITNDLERRLRAHREGRGARYTRGRLPLEPVYREDAPSRAAATRREREIKSLTREGKLALVASVRGGGAARRGRRGPR